MTSSTQAAIDALKLCRPYIEAEAKEKTGYGFFCGGDPRKFRPGSDATKKELESHKAACEAAEKGEMSQADGRWVGGVHLTCCQFGLGTYEYTDQAAVRALAALDDAIEALEARTIRQSWDPQ